MTEQPQTHNEKLPAELTVWSQVATDQEVQAVDPLLLKDRVWHAVGAIRVYESLMMEEVLEVVLPMIPLSGPLVVRVLAALRKISLASYDEDTGRADYTVTNEVTEDPTFRLVDEISTELLAVIRGEQSIEEAWTALSEQAKDFLSPVKDLPQLTDNLEGGLKLPFAFRSTNPVAQLRNLARAVQQQIDNPEYRGKALVEVSWLAANPRFISILDKQGLNAQSGLGIQTVDPNDDTVLSNPEINLAECLAASFEAICYSPENLKQFLISGRIPPVGLIRISYADLVKWARHRPPANPV